MKKTATLLLLFLSLSILGQRNQKSLNKFQKEYNALEFKVRNKTDSLNFVTTQKINKLSYDVKT